MRLLALLAAGLFAGSALAADDKKDDKKGKDEEAVLGTWKVDKLDAGTPEALPAAFFEKVRLTFKKDGKMSVVGPDGKEKDQEYKLDSAAKVKTIDIVTDGKTVPGLYELDGDTMKLCASMQTPKDDKKLERPTEIKADGKGLVVMTLKRVKDEKKDK